MKATAAKIIRRQNPRITGFCLIYALTKRAFRADETSRSFMESRKNSWKRVELTMRMNNELLQKIDEKYPRLSKGQKKLADYIRQEYDKAAFLTAAKMGDVVGVSESTVVRFAMTLGYKGYPEFQKALEELVRTKLNSIQRMEAVSYTSLRAH